MSPLFSIKMPQSFIRRWALDVRCWTFMGDAHGYVKLMDMTAIVCQFVFIFVSVFQLKKQESRGHHFLLEFKKLRTPPEIYILFSWHTDSCPRKGFAFVDGFDEINFRISEQDDTIKYRTLQLCFLQHYKILKC